MKPELEKLCADYIANRDTVQKVFKWDNSELYSVCANIFCAAGQAADADRLKECRQIIKTRTKSFSKFRSGKVRPILASMLALGEKPEERMDLAIEYYRLLKRNFKDTAYLVLAAFLLTDHMDQTLTEEAAARGKELYRRMNRKHRFLTDKTDSVFAMLMAYSGKTGDELIDEMEACYKALKGFFSSSKNIQTAAQVFSMTAGAPEEKAQRMNSLYGALTEAGVNYGHSAELAPLAALSLADTPVDTLVEEIREADEFLKGQKGYEGKKDEDQKKRAMHALMIVSDQYAGTSQVNITVMTNTLDMLFAQESAARLSLAFHLVEGAVQLLDGLSKSSDKTEGETAGQPDAEKQPEK